MAAQDDLVSLSADRAAIERAYYEHRLGTKPPFEQLLSRPSIEQMVRQDLSKEAVLKKTYAVTITPAQVEEEVNRINTTTRAPELLADLKKALGNEPARFARSVAKPIVVERILRERFENDDSLHAPQRREAEQMRDRLLNARKNGASNADLLAPLKQLHSNAVSETTWQLGNPPGADAKAAGQTPELAEIQKRFGPNAQLLSPAHGEAKDRKLYFADLPPELQTVLRAQLCQAGDVSAVIEMPTGFLLYLAKEKTADTLSAAVLSLPKRGFEEWLAEQGGDKR